MATNKNFAVWIDNDGCPKKVLEIVFKASQNRSFPVKVVANRYMHPPHHFVEVFSVSGDFDAADDYIANNVHLNDIVITSDIPLADRIVTAGAIAINANGEIFDKESIKEKLTFRNLNQELRSAGMISGGSGGYDQKKVYKFSNTFDRLIAQKINERGN